MGIPTTYKTELHSCTICLLTIEKNKFNCPQCTLHACIPCMLTWNRTISNRTYPWTFQCPICKIRVKTNIYNPSSRRYVYLYSKLGRRLKARMDKLNDPKFVLNPLTNRFVKRRDRAKVNGVKG